MVNRLKLNSLVQCWDEAITSFETRLKPLARTGKFKEKSGACGEKEDYTDQMVLDNLIRGLADDDIKKKVLAIPEENLTLEKVLQFVQAEEIGKLSLSDSKVLELVAWLSEYKLRQKVEGFPEQQVFKGCRFCAGKSRHSKDKCPANEKKCHDCELIGHFKRQCKFIK